MIDANGKTIIFLLWEGIYSDASVIGAFSTREAADMAAGFCGRDERRVEEIELDAPECNTWPFWWVTMRHDGTVDNVYNWSKDHEDSDYWSTPHEDGIYTVFQCYCYAHDKEHAVKIANERRAMDIASGRDRRERVL